VGVVLAQLLQLIAATFQTMAGDRLTAYVTEQVIRAANRWPGLARFEDPTFADDLHRTRTAASRGGLSIMVHGATGVMHLVTVVGASLVLLHLNPFVPALLLLASLPAMARQWEYVCRVGMHLYDQTPEARRLAYYRATLLSGEPAKDVRLYLDLAEELGHPLCYQLRSLVDDEVSTTLNQLDAHVVCVRLPPVQHRGVDGDVVGTEEQQGGNS